MTGEIPLHLEKYIVAQDYSKYTAEDQAVWRYVLRQLHSFMSEHAHPAYVEGVKKTGIELDRIPHIERVSQALEKFGWRAVPVSGFIPPAAFMELQSLGYLPIASDMRSLEHLTYTPAPDIVHEAAGHAPILIDPEFAAYLKQYAEVARNALISSEDLDLYEAIRILSDVKESPNSSADEIAFAEQRLTQVSKGMSFVSEAALLGRMNWWTAEYGLFGKLSKPKIFGAGLLSSVGEAKNCLRPEVKKIPLSIDCINYSYDITEQQPQLFVTPSFAQLGDVLEELSQKMAFRKGGNEGLNKAMQAKTVCTAVLDSGLQISGQLAAVHAQEQPVYINFTGPTQLSYKNVELLDHSTQRHPMGFGCPLGVLENETLCLSKFSESELARVGIRVGHRVELKYRSGVIVKGLVHHVLYGSNQKPLVITFRDCHVLYRGDIFFHPEWGEYDLTPGAAVVSVFGGAADRNKYVEAENFAARRVPARQFDPQTRVKLSLYQEMTDLASSQVDSETRSGHLEKILEKLDTHFANDWLLYLEVFETAKRSHFISIAQTAMASLDRIGRAHPKLLDSIESGLRLVRDS